MANDILLKIEGLRAGVEDKEILKGVDRDLDREAIRVVKKMPRWQPGKNNGVAVRSYFNLPVVFRLQNQ